MTKEQFIKFKQDFKAVVEETKINKKYRKEWWNLGFKSEEEFKHVKDLDMSKIKELIKDVLIYNKDSYYNNRIYGYSTITHWTYYCLKHRLDKTEREQYIKEQFIKLKCEKQLSWDFLNIPSVINKVEKIISSYEKI